MAGTLLITTGEFARLSRTTKNTLHHYDKIGLLSPMSRGEDNNYRYYTYGQLAVINVVRTLQDLDMSLEDIKNVLNHRSTTSTIEMLAEQIERIDIKISGWLSSRRLLQALKSNIEAALFVDENTITVQFLPAENIMLGNQIDYGLHKNDFDALVDFYNHIDKKYSDANLNYPACALFSEERIKLRDCSWPDRYYFRNPSGKDKKPTALYAIGYRRGAYGDNTGLYQRLFDYIEQNDFEICGNAYLECPINEICVSDDHNYLTRIMIAVRQNSRDGLYSQST